MCECLSRASRTKWDPKTAGIREAGNGGRKGRRQRKNGRKEGGREGRKEQERKARGLSRLEVLFLFVPPPPALGLALSRPNATYQANLNEGTINLKC